MNQSANKNASPGCHLDANERVKQSPTRSFLVPPAALRYCRSRCSSFFLSVIIPYDVLHTYELTAVTTL